MSHYVLNRSVLTDCSNPLLQTHMSYAELHAAVAVVARGLLGLGIGPGEQLRYTRFAKQHTI